MTTRQPNESDSSSELSSAVDPAAGISLRDYFAGQAIQGILGASSIVYYFNHGQSCGTLEAHAADAYRMADAMLAAREAAHFDALADAVEAMTDEEVLADAVARGVDVTAESERVRGLLLAKVEEFKARRLNPELRDGVKTLKREP